MTSLIGRDVADEQERVRLRLAFETVCHPSSYLSLVIRSTYHTTDIEQTNNVRFWGDSIYRAGAGPMPVPPKKLNAQTLAEAIETALDPKVKEMAEKIGENIRAEQGEMKGVESFHRHLPLLNMRYVRDYSSSVRH